MKVAKFLADNQIAEICLCNSGVAKASQSFEISDNNSTNEFMRNTFYRTAEFSQSTAHFGMLASRMESLFEDPISEKITIQEQSKEKMMASVAEEGESDTRLQTTIEVGQQSFM